MRVCAALPQAALDKMEQLKESISHIFQLEEDQVSFREKIVAFTTDGEAAEMLTGSFAKASIWQWGGGTDGFLFDSLVRHQTSCQM